MLCFNQEVARIRNEHLDDASAVINDRVKGSLKVTRAFGAGFLKQVCVPSGEIPIRTSGNRISVC